MSTDDTPDGDGGEAGVADDRGDVRDRIEREADRAIEGFDQNVVDLLSWVLESETRARIYVHLRQHPESTSDEVAEGTGLYPSTVREALAELHEEGKLTREKRANSGAGNNPYEYSAMAPSDLVGEVIDDIQSELNTVFNLDRYLDRDDTSAETEPVTITVEDERSDDSPADDEAVEAGDADDETGSSDADASETGEDDAADQVDDT